MELRKHRDIIIDVVVSSSLILDKYANASQDIENDGFKIKSKIDCLLAKDSHESMVSTCGISLIHHSKYFDDNRPDLLLVVGDRFDMFPTVFAASIMNIPIAHIQGGETSGTIDDKIRDITSQLSDIHFPATEKSRARLVGLGVDNFRIFNYGCPAVEYITKVDVKEKYDSHMLLKKFKHDMNIQDGEKYFISMIHPDTTNPNDVDMSIILDAINTFNTKTVVFYPNTDTHNTKILHSIAEYKHHSNFYFIKHMPMEGYIHLLAHSSCLIGNSSSGIRESASFGVPFINIGDRQYGREQNNNTFNVECIYDDIVSAIEMAINEEDNIREKYNIYLKENCAFNISHKIIDFLEGVS